MQEKRKPPRSKHYWEMPLGTIRGFMEEPGPKFVDPYDAEERKAIEELEGTNANTTYQKKGSNHV